MERGTNNSEPARTGSFSRTSSLGSSLRKRSLSISSVVSAQIDDDIHSETVSEAGDIGDRALQSNRHSVSSSVRLSVDCAMETGTVIHPAELNTISLVSPLPEDITFPLPIDPLKCSEDKRQEKRGLPLSLEYISCLIHLAVFGILGVGSFLMGWWGVVFKGDISQVSDILAIGLTTGYLGSLTTFSGWNQKMLDLSVNGHWVQAVLGFLIGLFLAAYSIIFGIETAKGFRWILKRLNTSTKEVPNISSNWRLDSCRRQLAAMVVLLLVLGVILSVSGALLKEEFGSGSSGAQLWLACLVGPLGVWIRWFLARLNGRGLGKSGILRWLPFGTLIANVFAACVMAALSTVKRTVNTKNFDTVSTGMQLGFLGCLSTVSTFIAEFNAMRESKHPWRAYAYALITTGVSFGLGILIYNVPAWTKGFT
ncbi:Camphor resistance CrcB family protein, putative isoform 2 [Theobroma cacao]|uniref:Camphor resistance CrcB family protein, putative isoform 2 n=1 Tax=Theobroma cacao TaxID=3641 RepID=A0A061FHS5_THECC|nr:Camphor resistance CrcB family protein, putative isoform 2 [Theobroma cacao]